MVWHFALRIFPEINWANLRRVFTHCWGVQWYTMQLEFYYWVTPIVIKGVVNIHKQWWWWCFLSWFQVVQEPKTDIQRRNSLYKRWSQGISSKMQSHMEHSSMYVHHMDLKKKRGQRLRRCKGQAWHPTSSTTVHCSIHMHPKASTPRQNKF